MNIKEHVYPVTNPLRKNILVLDIEPNYGDKKIEEEFKEKPKVAKFIWALITKISWLILKFYGEENIRLSIRNQKFALERIQS